MDAGYMVGRALASDYVSFSRSYPKHDREPLKFIVENLDSGSDERSKSSSPCFYGRCFVRAQLASLGGESKAEQQDPPSSSSSSSNLLLDRVNELKVTADSVTYQDIKATVVAEFGESIFDESKELVHLLLEYPRLTSSKGLMYRTQDGFIKICQSKYFGGLSTDQFIFFILDEENMGYGELIEHEDKVRIRYVDQTSRAAWNLEQRLYMGGVGDGINSFYMTTNQPDDDNFFFVVQDVDYKFNATTKMATLENQVSNLRQSNKNAQELIQLLRVNNGEAESEVQKEHKHNEYMQAELVHKDVAYQAQLQEKNVEMKLLGAQKKLLKNECRRLQACQVQSEERMNEMKAMKDIDMAEMETLRKQLVHQQLAHREQLQQLQQLQQSMVATNEANVTNVTDKDDGDDKGGGGPIKTSSFVSTAANSSDDDESSSASQKQTKREKKAIRRRSRENAGEVLNLQSKVSFLSSEVQDLGRENAALKRELNENDLMVKDLGGKLHLLVVENEKLKGGDR